MIMVMTNRQGTACSETALCDEHFLSVDHQKLMRQRAAADVSRKMGFVESDSPGLRCQICGVNKNGNY